MERYKRNDDNLASKIHDEVVMVNITQGNYFGLNSVGSDIWELLQEPCSVEELCEKLMNDYDIDKESCLRDINSFIKELMKNDIVIKV